MITCFVDQTQYDLPVILGFSYPCRVIFIIPQTTFDLLQLLQMKQGISSGVRILLP
ncbi:hypothetical protein [Spirochaeta cellobiosiphila]|uniref:hypothetical protein n=1 Tax=Spirochaeta cellobiosiphila TaxID=504483 RepID=UPI00040B158B|nr:hypothetical protein [Spirochaeta cellobiosiphila]